MARHKLVRTRISEDIPTKDKGKPSGARKGAFAAGAAAALLAFSPLASGASPQQTKAAEKPSSSKESGKPPTTVKRLSEREKEIENIRKQAMRQAFLNPRLNPELRTPEAVGILDAEIESVSDVHGGADLLVRIARLSKGMSLYLGGGAFFMSRPFYSEGLASEWGSGFFHPPMLELQRHGGSGTIAVSGKSLNGFNVSSSFTVGGYQSQKILDNVSENTDSGPYWGFAWEMYPVKSVGLGMVYRSLEHLGINAFAGIHGAMPWIRGPAELFVDYRHNGALNKDGEYLKRHLLEASVSLPILRLWKSANLWLSAISNVRNEWNIDKPFKVEADVGGELRTGFVKLCGGYTINNGSPFVGVFFSATSENLLRAWTWGFRANTENADPRGSMRMAF